MPIVFEHKYFVNMTYIFKMAAIFFSTILVADPGFPVGGVDLVVGAPTPEAVTFRKICMWKRKNLLRIYCRCTGPKHTRKARGHYNLHSLIYGHVSICQR